MTGWQVSAQRGSPAFVSTLPWRLALLFDASEYVLEVEVLETQHQDDIRALRAEPLKAWISRTFHTLKPWRYRGTANRREFVFVVGVYFATAALAISSAEIFSLTSSFARNALFALQILALASLLAVTVRRLRAMHAPLSLVFVLPGMALLQLVMIIASLMSGDTWHTAVHIIVAAPGVVTVLFLIALAVWPGKENTHGV